MDFPELVKIHQVFNDEHIEDIAAHVEQECSRWEHLFDRNETIALAMGSRGISNMALIARTVVSFFKQRGNEVIIFPAMGSHGGATAEGQREVLEGYGITEEYTGAEIRSSMEVVELDSSGLENRAFIDENAYSCDSIIVINRIKAHTDFTGEIESGLLKMSAIGLGKQKQAQEIHSRGVYGLKELLVPTAERIIREANVKLGFAIVENSYHQTQIFRGIAPEEFYTEEKKLLEVAKANIAQLPVKGLDILCVDEMGKNISGVGIDVNVIGDIGIRNEPPKNDVKIKNIIVNDITPESHGNAIGMGLADIITEQFRKKIDYRATNENTITSSFLERAKTPMVAPTYKDALGIALQVTGKGPDEVRLVRIRNTQELSEIYVSRAVYREIEDSPNIEKKGDFTAWDDLGPL